MKKKFLTLFLAAMLTLSLAACGNEDSQTKGSGSQVEAGAEGESGSVQKDEKNEKDEKDEKKDVQSDVNPIEEALKNMNAASSMEAEMVMDMDMTISANGQEMAMQTVTTMDMVCFYDNLKIKMDMTVDMGDLGSQAMKVYMDTDENGNMTTYMYDGQKWVSEVAGELDMEEYDARRAMNQYLDSDDIAKYKEEGIEDIDGFSAYKYSYAMSGEEMKEALLTSGSLDSFSSLGMTESQLDSMLDDMGEMVTYVWIDVDSLYPIRYEMDMTDIMDALMTNMVSAMGDQAAGMSISIPKMAMTMKCYNYNNATDFTVPEEAKSAN